MPIITIETSIKADIEICFDLSRSIDLHQISTEKTNEKARAGTTSGLIGLGESVTWQATHLGVRQKLTSSITAYDKPFHFRDEQVNGIFHHLMHDHYFEKQGDMVIMKDIFDFASPFGFLGSIVDKLFLSNYLKRFLIDRNKTIKEFAETGKWQSLLTVNWGT